MFPTPKTSPPPTRAHQHYKPTTSVTVFSIGFLWFKLDRPMSRFPSLLPFLFFFSSNVSQPERLPPSRSPPTAQCRESCGDLRLPFPFHLHSKCGPAIDAFHVLCRGSNSSASPAHLFLDLKSTELRIIDFFPDSATLLVDFPREYFHVNESRVLDGNPFYGVTTGNVLRLYDCEDSTVCRSKCVGNNGTSGGDGCCYSLKDGNVWKVGDGFSVFSQYGCRGFSSWLVKDSSTSSSTGGSHVDGMVVVRGLEIEWAVPRRLANQSVCAVGATVVNATAVHGGVRCECPGNSAGDGFADGVGCLKDCSTVGNSDDAGKCCSGWFCQKGATIIIGILVGVLVIAALVMFCTTLRWRVKAKCWNSEKASLPSVTGRNIRTEIFTYEELSKATRGFNEDQKLVEEADLTVHTGQLNDGYPVAVQKIICKTGDGFLKVLDKVEKLAHISHKNVAQVIGCCTNPNNTLLLVHEYMINRSLEELLEQKKASGLDWCSRMNIAVDVANALAFLQLEFQPSFYISKLKSRDILVGDDYSAKICCFKILSSCSYADECSSSTFQVSHTTYDFGLLLLEIVVGLKHEDLLTVVLPKISSGHLEEVVDPFLAFGSLPSQQRKQVEWVAHLATQCLLSWEDNTFSMVDVLKELIFIMKCSGNENMIDPPLDVSFSNSSLLQMISMSPESNNLM